MKKIFFIIFIFIILLGFLFLSDRIIGFLGFPKDIPIKYTHPKNFKEKRKNIEYEFSFATNSQGLRYKDIPLKKTENEFRIFMVGDSFTEGIGVNASETFGSLLEKHFNSTEDNHISFINGGLAGTGPLAFWRIFLNVGLKYNLDGLLICFYSNDLSDMPELITTHELYSLYPERHGIKKLLHTLCPRIYTMLKGLRAKYIYKKKTKTSDFVTLISKRAEEIGIPKERIERWKKNLPKKLISAVNKGEFCGAILSWGLLRPRYLANSLDIDTEKAEKKYQLMIVVLEEMVKEAVNRGIEVGLVYIPSRAQYDYSVHMPTEPWIQAGAYFRKEWLSDKSELQRRLDQWTNNKKIPYLDLTPIFRKEIQNNWPLNYRLDWHWNQEGNKVASIAISNWIEKEKVFSFTK